MPELISIEKTAPVKLLESRRSALIKWLTDGQHEIAEYETKIAERKQEAIDMTDEIAQIETALSALHGVAVEESVDAA